MMVVTPEKLAGGLHHVEIQGGVMRCEIHFWNPSLIRGLVAELPCPYPNCERGTGDGRDFWMTRDVPDLLAAYRDPSVYYEKRDRLWTRAQWRDTRGEKVLAGLGIRREISGWTWIEKGRPLGTFASDLDFFYPDGGRVVEPPCQ